MKFLDTFKKVRCGSLQMVEDRFPDKLRPLRFTETTLKYLLQVMPVQLQGLESMGFQLWRLRTGSVREFLNSIRMVPSSFNDRTETIMQQNIIVKCKILWTPITGKGEE